MIELPPCLQGGNLPRNAVFQIPLTVKRGFFVAGFVLIRSAQLCTSEMPADPDNWVDYFHVNERGFFCRAMSGGQTGIGIYSVFATILP